MMKHKPNKKKSPFFYSLLITTLLFSVIGFLGRNTLYGDISFQPLKTPLLSLVFQGMGEGIYPTGEGLYPWTDKVQQVAAGQTGSDALDSEDESSNGNTFDEGSSGGNSLNEPSSDENSSGKDSSKENSSDGNSSKGNSSDGNSSKGNSSEGNSSKNNSSDGKNTGTGDKGNLNPSGSHKGGKDTGSGKGKPSKDPSKTEPNGSGDSKEDNGDSSDDTYTFQTVKQSYFNDALFIGDSRTVGLCDYSGWSNPTFHADVGLTIYDVLDKKIADEDGHKATLEDVLQSGHFGKIYIMLGINELGRGTTESFTQEYEKVLTKIHEAQPDAIIFIQGIMNVSKEKSDKDPIFNNKNIGDRNNSLKKLADNKEFFYIDVNQVITDKSGGIPSEYTFDNIHLKAAYYKIWTDFLLKHGIVKDQDKNSDTKDTKEEKES